MARRPQNRSVTGPAPALEQTPETLRLGIGRLQRRLEEVSAFDPATLTDQFHHPNLDALKASITDALSRTFGESTSEYRRYANAASFNTGPIIMGYETPLQDVRAAAQESKERSAALLGQAIASLQEQLEEMGTGAAVVQLEVEEVLTRRVFVVHGHDEGARETVARYLERIGFEPIILHEQANQGRTVIEKIEAH